ncbi:hypothetical protein GQ457_02G014020 [Hibiscus cannabinus]
MLSDTLYSDLAGRLFGHESMSLNSFLQGRDLLCKYHLKKELKKQIHVAAGIRAQFLQVPFTDERTEKELPCGCWDSSPGLHGHNVEFSPLNYSHFVGQMRKSKNSYVAAGIRAQVSTATTWNSHH